MAEVYLPTVDLENFAEIVVQTEDGGSVKLSSLWQTQNAIFVFLRHFACIACRAHAKQVWQDRAKYESTNCKLVFIGNGQSHYIRSFKEDLGMEGALVLTDPSLECFYSAGFKAGFFHVVNPTSAANAIKLLAKGYRQAAYSKDCGTHWQLGGVLAIGTQGNILYQFISESLGDFPDEPNFDDILSDEENTLNRQKAANE